MAKFPLGVKIDCFVCLRVTSNIYIVHGVCQVPIRLHHNYLAEFLVEF